MSKKETPAAVDLHRMDLAGERKRTRPCAITDEMETKAPTDILNEKSIFPSLSILPVGEKESMRISGSAGRDTKRR